MLSACNTAGGNGTATRRGYAGLARAFMFAGGPHHPGLALAGPRRRLGAADACDTITRAPAAAAPAQALRSATLRADGTTARSPTRPIRAVWAPFAVVGR